MNPECLPLLCDPDTHAPLTMAQDALLDPESGARYPIRDGIPIFRTDAEFFGIDLSWGMLRRCVRNLTGWRRSAHLFQGEAERLPFRDAVFNSVCHVGGINFFNDKARAIEEMIRVAKPGAKIVILDETEKVVREMYRKNPLTQSYFQGQDKEAYCPIDLVPAGMREKQARLCAEGKLYCLTFRKP
jgi:SAM-dependent methyltransferase